MQNICVSLTQDQTQGYCSPMGCVDYIDGGTMYVTNKRETCRKHHIHMILWNTNFCTTCYCPLSTWQSFEPVVRGGHLNHLTRYLISVPVVVLYSVPHSTFPSVCFPVKEGQRLWEKDRAAVWRLTFRHHERCLSCLCHYSYSYCRLTVDTHLHTHTLTVV